MIETLHAEGFREIPYAEQKEINGGIWPVLLAGVLIAAAAQIIQDWDNFKNGLTGRPEVKVIDPQ